MFPVRLLVRLLLATSLVLLLGSRASGQVDPGSGFPAFGSFNRDAVDTINVGNLNVHFQVPVFAKKGRGLDFFADIVHDNTPYRTSGASPYYFWQVTEYLSWGITSNGGYLFYTGTSATQPCNYNGQNYWPTTYTNFAFVDANRTSHSFGPASIAFPAPCGSPQTTSAQSADGYLLSVTINPTSGAFTTKKVTDPGGNVFDALSNTLTDPNGNYISGVAAGTATVTDTTGNTVMTESSTTSSQTYNFPNPTGGVSEPVTLTTSPFTLKTNFRCPDLPDSFNPSSINLTTSVSLPDSTSYSIVYESTTGTYPSSNVTGRIHSLTLPSGATITYTYSGGTNGINCQDGSPAILTKQTPDGTWTYNHYFTPTVNSYGLWTTIVTDPAGNDTVYTFGSIPTTTTPATNTLEDQRLIYQGSHTSGTLLKTIVTCYNGNFTNCATAYNELGNLPLVVTRKDVYTYLAGVSQPSLSETFYDALGRTVQDNEFDFGVNTGAAPTSTPLQATITSYANIGNNIENRPACVQVTAGSSPATCGTVTSTTNSITNYPTYDSHGNLQTIQSWVSGSTYITRGMTYLSNGLLSTETDFRQTPTNYTYGACNGSYPTQITTAGLSQYLTWDCNGGAITTSMDANSKTTSYSYINATTGVGDPFWRLSQVTYPDGGKTTVAYNDAASPASVITNQLINSAGVPLTTQTNFDGLGRPILKMLTSDPDTTTYTATTYDALGRVYCVSNPYRSTASATDGITTQTYDALNRVTAVQPPDYWSATSTGSPTCQSVTPQTTPANPTNYVATSYSGNATTVTDQAGKSRKSLSDALDRLTKVFEDPAGLNYETDYTYDASGDLLSVTQKGGSTNWRTRTFTYDGLSRLTQEINPESGTATYSYDPNSNLIAKTSPAPNQTGSATITLSYCYDSLNRVTSKAYTAQACPMSAPIASYFYDQTSYNGITITNGIGRRTGMSDQAGSEARSYDSMGRPLTVSRTTNNVTKTFPYTYNFDGSLNTLTYPNAFTVTYTQGGAGRPLQLASGSFYIAVNAHYAPNGDLCYIQQGWNGTWTTTKTFNSRLQPATIQSVQQFSSPAPPVCGISQIYSGGCCTSVLDLKYSFTDASGHDNGNVVEIYNNLNMERTQLFSYDSLNRLATAETLSTNQPWWQGDNPLLNCWGEQYTYDAWGNFSAISPVSSAYTGCSQESLSMYPTTKNQLQDTNNDYVYDAAGNLTQPGPIGGPYVYDAENHLTSAGGVTYTYDGDGNRVMKSNGTIYWYGANSAALEESDLSGNLQRWYYFFNGQRVGRQLTTNEVGFYMTDHLGSVRYLGGSATGYKLDYYPYGGVILDSDTGDDRYQFTGEERDAESGLDNFGARYNSSSLGRFLSPDPGNAGAVVGAPQSWNAYSYVLNNPLNFVDPTGLDCIYIDNDTGKQTDFSRGDCDNSTEEKANSGYYVDGTVDRSSIKTMDDWVGYTYKPDGSPLTYVGGQCWGNCPNDATLVTAPLSGTPPVPSFWNRGNPTADRIEAWVNLHILPSAKVISAFSGLDPGYGYCGSDSEHGPEGADHPAQQTAADENLNNMKEVKNSSPKRPGPAPTRNPNASANAEKASTFAELPRLINNGLQCITNTLSPHH